MFMKQILLVFAVLVAFSYGLLDCSTETCIIDASNCVAIQAMPTTTDDVTANLCTIDLTYFVAGSDTNVDIADIDVDFNISGAYTTPSFNNWATDAPDYPRPTYWQGYASGDLAGSFPKVQFIETPVVDGPNVKFQLRYQTIVLRGAHICINTKYFDPNYRQANISFGIEHSDVAINTFELKTALWSTGDISPEHSGVVLRYDDETLETPNVTKDYVNIVDSVPMQMKVELKNPLDMPFQITDANWFIGSIMNELFPDGISTVSTESQTISTLSESSEDSTGLQKFIDMVKFELFTCADPADLTDYIAARKDLTGGTTPPANCDMLAQMSGGETVVKSCAEIIAAFDPAQVNAWFGAVDCNTNAAAVTDKVKEITATASLPTDFAINPPYAVIPVTISKLPGSVNLGFTLSTEDPLTAGNRLTIADMKVNVVGPDDTAANNIPSITSIKFKHDDTIDASPFVEILISKPVIPTTSAEVRTLLEATPDARFACSKLMDDEIGNLTHMGNNKCQLISTETDTTMRIFPSFKGTDSAFPLLQYLENVDNTFHNYIATNANQNSAEFMFMRPSTDAERFLSWKGSKSGVFINRTTTTEGERTVLNDKPLYLAESKYDHVLGDVKPADFIDASIDTWKTAVGSVGTPTVAIETGSADDDYTHIKLTFDSIPESVLNSPLSKVPMTLMVRTPPVAPETVPTFKTVQSFYAWSRKAFKASINFETPNFEVVDGKYVLHAFVSENLKDEGDLLLFHPLVKADVMLHSAFTKTVFNETDHMACEVVNSMVLEINPALAIKCSLPVRTPDFKPKAFALAVKGVEKKGKLYTTGNYFYFELTGDDLLNHLYPNRDGDLPETVHTNYKFTFDIGDHKDIELPVTFTFIPKTKKVVELKHTLYDGKYRISATPAVPGTFTIEGNENDTPAPFVTSNLGECRTVAVTYNSAGYEEATANVVLHPLTLNGATDPTFKVISNGSDVTAGSNIKARDEIDVEVTMPLTTYGTHVDGLTGCPADIKTQLKAATFYVYRVVVLKGEDILMTTTLSNSSLDKPHLTFSVPEVSTDDVEITIKVEISTQARYMGVKTITADYTLTTADPVSFADFTTELDDLLNSSAVEGFNPAEVMATLTAKPSTGVSADDKAKMLEKKVALIATSSNDLSIEDTARAIEKVVSGDAEASAALAGAIRTTMADKLSEQASIDLSSDDSGEAAERIKEITKNSNDIALSFLKMYVASSNVAAQAEAAISAQATADDIKNTYVDITTFAHNSSLTAPMIDFSKIVAVSGVVSADDACGATPVIKTDTSIAPQTVKISTYSTGATETGFSYVKMPDSFFNAAKNMLSSSACLSTSSVTTEKPSGTNEIYARTTLYNGDGELEYGFLKSNIATISFANSDNASMSDIFAATTGNMEVKLNKVADAPAVKCMTRLSTGSWATNGCTVAKEDDSTVTCRCPVSRVVRSATSAVGAFSSVPGLEPASSGSGIADAFGGSLGVLTLACIGGALILGVLGMVCGARASGKREKKISKKISPN